MRMSLPRSSRWVAKLWRSECRETVLRSHAALAASDISPALPATHAGRRHRRQGARDATKTRHFASRNRRRFRQELVPHRWPESARCPRSSSVPPRSQRPRVWPRGQKVVAMSCGRCWAHWCPWSSQMSAVERIVLKNSEIAALRKSRKCRMLAISAVARLCRIDTGASGRLCEN
jgi:hypothetical protein